MNHQTDVTKPLSSWWYKWYTTRQIQHILPSKHMFKTNNWKQFQIDQKRYKNRMIEKVRFRTRFQRKYNIFLIMENKMNFTYDNFKSSSFFPNHRGTWHTLHSQYVLIYYVFALQSTKFAAWKQNYCSHDYILFLSNYYFITLLPSYYSYFNKIMQSRIYFYSI